MATSPKATKFVEEPPALICPICQRIFHEPVISIKCGHTFCRRCIESMAHSGNSCPIDNITCDASQLVINRAVIGQIDDLSIYCCHAVISYDHGLTYEKDPNGCPEILKLGQRDKHECGCGYATVVCPVGGEECGRLRQKDLETHMSSCSRVPCPFSDFGCLFRGVKEQVIEHKVDCVYRDESQLLAITMKELKIVKTQNNDLQQSLTKAIKSLEKLSLEKQTMSSQMEQQALTITTLTSRMDKLESEIESFKSVKLRKNTNMIVTSSPMSVPTNNHAIEGNHTPVYQRRSYADPRRWSIESTSSLTSLPPLPEAQRGAFVWQMPFTLKCIGTFRGHKGTIWSLVTYGDRLFSSSSDGTIKVWDIADLRRGCLKTIPAHKEATMSLAIGRGILYSTGTDLSLRSWQLESVSELGKVENAHEGIISAMICSKDYIITSSFASIKFWDPLTLHEIHSIGSKQGLSHWVRAMVHDKRKDILYTGSHNKVHVWKIGGDYKLINEMSTSYGAIFSLAITKKYVIVGTHNQNIQVYDNNTLHHICSLTGHIGCVTTLKVTESPAGVYMFSGSSDSIVQVWNLENMLPIQALQRHEKPVQAMAVWHDTVFTGSEDEEIKVFKHFKL